MQVEGEPGVPPVAHPCSWSHGTRNSSILETRTCRGRWFPGCRTWWFGPSPRGGGTGRGGSGNACGGAGGATGCSWGHVVKLGLGAVLWHRSHPSSRGDSSSPTRGSAVSFVLSKPLKSELQWVDAKIGITLSIPSTGLSPQRDFCPQSAPRPWCHPPCHGGHGTPCLCRGTPVQLLVGKGPF